MFQLRDAHRKWDFLRFTRNPGTDEEPGPAESCEELLGKLRTQHKFLDLDLRTVTTAGYTANVLKCNLSGLIKNIFGLVFF